MFSTNFVLLDVTIPVGLIGDIRVEFDTTGLGDPCTVFVVAAFENDIVVIPRETSWFGYYPDGAFEPVLPP
ncbi:hypothetical protein ZWY2020_019281 [Hordeum vulgare]|nr:hypothetical protein ZWY2020_019281 [Hordeum vulgare]